jgi:hypothetical protein
MALATPGGWFGLCHGPFFLYHQRPWGTGGARAAPAPRVRVAFQLPILDRKPRRSARRGFLICKARWQSGHAAACKAVYAGSIPTLASSCHSASPAILSVFLLKRAVSLRLRASLKRSRKGSFAVVRVAETTRLRPTIRFRGEIRRRRYTPASTFIGDADALLCSPP